MVDEHNRPVPAGEDGATLLITVLDGRTLPLIRYEVDDSVRMATSPSACGLPFALVERILGRTWDALRLPGTGGGEVLVQPLTFTAILDTLPITGWQVVHDQTGTLTVLLTGVRDRSLTQTAKAQIERELTAQGVRLPSITVEPVAAIPRTAGGKAPQFRSAHVPGWPQAGERSQLPERPR